MAGSAVTELNVVTRLLTLSSDVANQPYIARRGILPTLKKFLTHSDLEVQTTAAKTLKLLASHPDNPEFIAQENGLVAAVLQAYDGAEAPDLKAELEGVMTHLKSATPQAEPAASTSTETKAYPVVPENHKRQLAPRNKADRAKVVRRRMTLRTPNISPANVDGLEYFLQNIRGMISYSIDTQNKTLNLFLSTPKHLLLKHLKDVGFESEVLEETVAKTKESGAGNTPSYMSAGEVRESDYKKSLVVQGEAKDVGGSSLAARLKEHKARNKAASEADSSVSGFFSGLARNLLS
eukprot:TRINITY_DN57665_c0_g1_i1.p1 TRINITY_DN57665_c0_g1~~TRINITY_DN57665_c0_g1_i1.p1  ORF type:complete len:293 (+),score=86.71 TRINITY_DN57665_c0_g1_i1:54-932(+)